MDAAAVLIVLVVGWLAGLLTAAFVRGIVARNDRRDSTHIRLTAGVDRPRPVFVVRGETLH